MEDKMNDKLFFNILGYQFQFYHIWIVSAIFIKFLSGPPTRTFLNIHKSSGSFFWTNVLFVLLQLVYKNFNYIH